MKAILLGAAGLVGGYLLAQLLDHPAYSAVVVYTRRATGVRHPKLIEFVTDFNDLQKIALPESIDVIFSALGTTRGKTRDLDQYRFIEIGILQFFIERLKSKGLKQVHAVSAIGAGGNSRNFYLRIKTELEDMVRSQEVETSCVYRPSMITGKRQEKRMLEKVAISAAKVLDMFLVGKAKKYKSVSAEIIALTMIEQALNPIPGHRVIYFHDK